MQDQPLIRLLQPEDVNALKNLTSITAKDQTLGPPNTIKNLLTPEELNKRLHPPFETIGAFSNQELLGAASLCPTPKNPLSDSSEKSFGLSLVMVTPSARGNGIGTKLIEECLSRAEQHGATEVLLEVYIPNPAKKLYESIGFKEWHTCENAYRHSEHQFHLVHMKKTLP